MLTNLLTVIGAVLLVHAGYSYRHCKYCDLLSLLILLTRFVPSSDNSTDNQLVSVLDIVESKYPPFDVSSNLIDVKNYSDFFFQCVIFQVIVELVVGFLLVVIAQTISLKLKPMKVSANIRSKTYAETMTNSDFMVFNHRGKFIADRLRSSVM